jgi:hypothetical protein
VAVVASALSGVQPRCAVLFIDLTPPWSIAT